MPQKNKSPLTEIEREKLAYTTYTRERKESERMEDARRTNTTYANSTYANSTYTSQPSVRAESQPISYEALKNYIATRDFLGKNIYKPNFNIFTNLYVRVAFPNGYAICRILDIVYGIEYKFQLGKLQFVTDRFLRIKHGDAKIKIPIAIISNSCILADEYDAHRPSFFDSEERVANDYNKVYRIMNKEPSREEQQRSNEEKRKFMFSFEKRKSFFKTDLLRLRKLELNNKNMAKVKAIDEALARICDESEKIGCVELNAIGRKLDLRITGFEVEQPKMIKIKER
ncbi:hypothetical protein COBT_000873 [Conglomerata obtusa]